MALEDGDGAEVALEDGSSVVALGADVGRWLKIAVMALGGGDGRKHAMMAFASESESSKPRAYYYNIGISVGKDGERGCVQCKGHTLAATARG